MKYGEFDHSTKTGWNLWITPEGEPIWGRPEDGKSYKNEVWDFVTEELAPNDGIDNIEAYLAKHATALEVIRLEHPDITSTIEAPLVSQKGKTENARSIGSRALNP